MSEMSEPRRILVEHYNFGPLEVVAVPEYKYWTGRSGFYCPDDPELGTFDEDELTFLDPPAAILEFKRP